MAENPQKSETAKREEEILAFWNEREIFKKSLEKKSPKGEFVFYEGPPTANGRPGIHHLESRAFKDAIPRFRTMQGYHVRRKAGWDTHGLPVELEVEKQIGSKSKKDIEAFGIARFNELCKESVLKYIDEWQKFTDRIGFWVDHKDTYFTFDNSYIESVWNVLKTANGRELLYKDYKVVPWCPRCGTALSSHEVAQGYQDDTPDPSVYVKFKVKPGQQIGGSSAVSNDHTYLLVWTTTPWTLPSNVALAVNPRSNYELVHDGGGYLIVEVNRKAALEIHNPYSSEIMYGAHLVGLEYEPLFPYLAQNLPEKEKVKLPNAYKVYAADFVSTEDGTGIVHIAPMYGADDFALGTANKLPKHHLVGEDGKFTTDAGPLAGVFFKKADEWVMDALESRQPTGLLYRKGKIKHTYPFCWRCKTPLIYYADDSWYIAMSRVRDTLIAENEKIHWEPEHIRDGRFGEWLKDVKDWAISRSRYWGTPLPIWECQKCKKFEVIGSIAELKEKAGSAPDDLHRPYIDEYRFKCECGGEMKRVPEVLDVWFDSGAMPFAQDHYPFATQNILYPADFISEAIDQTRGWFYTLHAVGAGIMDRGLAYKNVICLGHVLDAKGKKMSKSVGNVVDPWTAIDKYGVDALRFFMYTVNAPGDSKNFDERMVDEIVKKNIGRLGNVLAFYKLYADETPRGGTSAHILDRWILARLDQLIGEATKGFEGYRIDEATRPISAFIDDLSTWYLRRSRDRFKEEGAEKTAALATLRFVLVELSKILAPAMPFFAEYLFQAVREDSDEESVHLAAWPEPRGFDADILKGMAQARDLVTEALEARDKAGIKVRQPLATLSIPKDSDLADEYLSIIAEEVNVKKVEKKGSAVALDTALTDELREEGVVRDTLRLVQDARKAAKMRPGEHGAVSIAVPADNRTIVERRLHEIEEQTNASITLE